MRAVIIMGSVISLLIFSIMAIRNYEVGVMEVHVGEKVIIGNDTLTIISFSTFTDEYMLNNGTSISDAYLLNMNKP